MVEYERKNVVKVLLLALFLCELGECKDRYKKRKFDSKEDSDEDHRRFKREDEVPPTPPPPKKSSFRQGFMAATSMTITAEFGDRTFFIVAILAMNHPKVAVFLGAMLACFIMTIMSAGLGVITTFLPDNLTYYISTFLYIIFGILMLKEGWSMSATNTEEEIEEAEEEVKKREDKMYRDDHKRKIGILSKLIETFLEAFSLNFFGEWGDRSQFTTLVLAAREDTIAVTLGCSTGHAICLLLALAGGKIVAQKLSARSVTLFGGALFILFALISLVSK